MALARGRKPPGLDGLVQLFEALVELDDVGAALSQGALPVGVPHNADLDVIALRPAVVNRHYDLFLQVREDRRRVNVLRVAFELCEHLGPLDRRHLHV